MDKYYKLRLLLNKDKLYKIYDSAILGRNVNGFWHLYCVDKFRVALYGVYESKLEALFAYKILLN